MIPLPAKKNVRTMPYFYHKFFVLHSTVEPYRISMVMIDGAWCLVLRIDAAIVNQFQFQSRVLVKMSLPLPTQPLYLSLQ